MSIANYLENKFLDTLRNVSYSTAGTYIKLHISDPGEDCTSGAAAVTTRVAVTWSAASGGSLVSSNTPQWTNYAATETVSHISIWDTATDSVGNALWYGQLSASKTMQTGDTLTLTSLTLSLD
jgi:hypothetical protein